MRRRLNAILLIVLGLAVFVTLFLLAERPQVGPPELPPEEAPAAGPGGDADLVIRPFRFNRTLAGRLELEIEAREARSYREADELVIEGIEKVAIYDENGRQYRFSAERGRHRKAANEFVVSGNVRGLIVEPDPEQPPLAIATDEIVVSVETRRASTRGPVRLERGGITTTAEHLTIDSGERRVVLEDNVVTRVTSAPGEGGREQPLDYPLEVRAGELTYDVSSQVATYSRSPRAGYGATTAQASRISLRFDERDRQVVLEGQVRLHLVPEEPGQEPIDVASERLEADPAAHLLVFPVRTLVERGPDRLEADRIEILLAGERGGLAGAVASGQVIAISGERQATCGRAVYDRAADSLILTESPVVHEGNSRVAAQVMQVFPERRFTRLEGGVSGQYSPAPGGGPGGGPSLFAFGGAAGAGGGRQPVSFGCRQAEIDGIAGRARFEGELELHRGAESFFTERALAEFDPGTGQVQEIEMPLSVRYSMGDRVLVADRGAFHVTSNVLDLNGHCKAFQGSDYTRSGRMRLHLGEDRAEAWDNVETYIENVRAIAGEDGSAAPERAPLTVRALRAEFDNGQGRIGYTGSVTAVQKDMQLATEKLVVQLAEGGRQVRTITAEEEVRIQRGDLQADAARAVFDQSAGELVLTGTRDRPARIQQADRSTAGERIVIDLTSRSYRVEAGESIVVPHGNMGPSPGATPQTKEAGE